MVDTDTRNLGVSEKSVVAVVANKGRVGELRPNAVGTSVCLNQLVGLSTDKGVTRVGSRDRAVRGSPSEIDRGGFCRETCVEEDTAGHTSPHL